MDQADAKALLSREILDALQERGVHLAEIDWDLERTYEAEAYTSMAWFESAAFTDNTNPIPDILPLFIRLLMELERDPSTGPILPEGADEEFFSMEIRLGSLAEYLTGSFANEDKRIISLLLVHVTAAYVHATWPSPSAESIRLSLVTLEKLLLSKT